MSCDTPIPNGKGMAGLPRRLQHALALQGQGGQGTAPETTLGKEGVAILLPTYNGQVDIAAARTAYWMPTRGRPYFVVDFTSSLLSFTFNSLWQVALTLRDQGKARYVAMIHADLEAEQGWVDRLIDELQRMKADIVSAVVPIKDTRGVTSTAIDDPADPYDPWRRLTMHEVARLPPTFNAADCGYPDRALLINTGLWVADLRGAWCNGVCFTVGDAIRKAPAGHPAAGQAFVGVSPEDWNFSRYLHQQKARVYATQVVRCAHTSGRIAFAGPERQGPGVLAGAEPENRWWAWETDEGTRWKWGAAGEGAIGMPVGAPAQKECVR